MVYMANKTCRKCEQSKPTTDFHRDKKNKDGYYYSCKECASADQKRLYDQRKLDKAAKTLVWQYNITQEQYDEMMERQGGTCAICDQPCPSGKRLHVDHDHSCCPGIKSCGKCVRGLLCTNCNNGLGRFKDDVALLGKAITYLSSSNSL